MSEAAKIAWPGNDLPTFRGNKTSTNKKDDLVKELLHCAHLNASLRLLSESI